MQLLAALVTLLPMAQVPDLEQARAALPVPAVEAIGLDPSQAPAGQAWTLALEFEGQRYLAHLEPSVVRAPGYLARAQTAEGPIDVSLPSLGTWRGHLVGQPQVPVAVGRGPDGLRVAVLDGEQSWFAQPLSSLVPGAAGHVAYRGQDPFAQGACGVDDRAPSLASATGGTPEAGTDCLSLTELALDINYERFLYSSDVAIIQGEVDAYVNAVAAIHTRDFLVDYVISHLEIRTTPNQPYTSNDPGTLLNQMRSTWTSDLAGVQRDVAHLLVGQEMTGNIIGLAWVGTVCNFGYMYGLTQGNLGFGGVVSVLSHELGHNWNAPHCLDTDGCYQMCGGCTVFGPNTVAHIKQFIAGLNCLDPAPPASVPVPPYAAADSAAGFGPLTLDPLANDHDANCEPLTLSVPATSNQGGALSVLTGQGPGGRDLLRYVPPGLDFEGLDTFDVTVTDPAGLNATGPFRVVLRDGLADLVAHYPLDDFTGSVMEDASPFGRDGTYWDGANLGLPGADPATGFSVRFAGAPQRARHPNADSPVGALREDLTVALWVKPEQLSGFQRYYGNLGTWTLGQSDDRLLFTTHGIKDYLSGPVLTAGQWQHVAFVFSADHDVRFYLNGAFVAQVNGAQASLPTPLDGWYLATLNHESEYLVGSLDDLQVYDQALTDSQVLELYQQPGQTLGSDCDAFTFCEATPSSAGNPVSILNAGSLSVAQDDFTLLAANAPAGQFGLFFYGPDFQLLPVAGGNLCVAGLTRMGALQVDALGLGSWPVNLAQPAQGGPAILADSTWCFQFWYRDPGLAAGSNFSDALVVRFCP